MNTTTTPAAFLAAQLPAATRKQTAAFSAFLTRYRDRYTPADTTHPRRFLYSPDVLKNAFDAWSNRARTLRPAPPETPPDSDPLELARRALTVYSAERPADSHGFAIIAPSFPIVTGKAPTQDKALTAAAKLARAIAATAPSPVSIITF